MRTIGIAVAALIGVIRPAFADKPVIVSLDGEWDFTWTPTSSQEIPTVPDAAAFDVTARVPGRWDDQLDRFKPAKWWRSAQFKTALGPVRYLYGVGWHRRTFDVPAGWKDRAVRLTIGWAVGQMHVWLNGEHVGRYDYGVYTPYALDLTNCLKLGQPNELVISVDSTRGFAGGWALLGNAGRASGITRPVTLEVTAGRGRIANLYVRPGKDLNEVVWDAELDVPIGDRRAPTTKLAWRVIDLAKQTTLASGAVHVPAFEGSTRRTWRARIDAIKPWSPKRPNLYWTEIEWTGESDELWDARRQRFGLRRWSKDGRRLKLNGKIIYLRGEFGAYYYPIHCTTPTSKDYWVRHVKRAKQIGMNYINFAARVCPIELLEAADELGMVMQCGDHMTVLEQHRGAYKEVWTPIVRWTRSHPSMCIYGFGGERNYYEGIIEQYQRQYDLIKSLHPECLVMPQQAIRGIDYAFDEQGRKELTREPFPHHAERLARYTKACDVFGHYSGGAFGYSYFSTPWREMEKRFTIYTKPLSMHELFMGMCYLNPDNAAKYTGRVPPYLYTRLREDLTNAGLLDRWRTYFVNSARLQGICKKYCLEKTRKCNELAGFEFLGMMDMHFTEHYTTGILDEFLQLKPGDTISGILRYNGESVLLIDYAGGSINRSYWAGDRFDADIMVSHYGDTPIRDATLGWALRDDSHEALVVEHRVGDVPNGRVTTVRKLGFDWPDVEETTRVKLSARLRGGGYDIANDWDFWVFPRRDPPRVVGRADEKALRLLSGRYPDIEKDRAGSKPRLKSGRVRILSRLTQHDVEHLAGGGDVLLLGAAPFTEYTAWRSFRPGLGAREHHNVGTVIARHPIFADLPHEGWGDWQFYPILEGASCVHFEPDLETDFDPILEVISSAEDVRRQAAVFEKRIGKGRLFVSTCTFDPNNPSCVALMDGILRYVQSESFRPRSALAEATLEAMCKPADPSAPGNLVASPSFENRSRVRRDWLTYGGEYALDDAVAHSGKRSLKLTITPETYNIDPRAYTGARAKTIQFKTSPGVVKVSAWHKTKGLTGSKGNSFLIFIYISYRGGGRHTLRLHFDQSDHDWQYAETTWRPKKELAGATLYIGLGNQSGTAWIDDVTFGAAPSGLAPAATSRAVWRRRAVTIDFRSRGLYRINAGNWTAGQRVRVAQEGVNTIEFKKQPDDRDVEIREVRIDVTPPIIELETRPVLAQEGGVYFAAPETEFAFRADDKLSGVKAVEVSIDGAVYAAHRGPIRLPKGSHTLRCRATDVAGNRSEIITGRSLTGGRTAALEVAVR